MYTLNSIKHPQRTLSSLIAACLLVSPLITLGADQPAKAGTPQAAASPVVPAPEVARWEKEFPQIASGKWTGPKLADGQPNISGHWSNTIANHNNFTDPQGGIPNDPNPNRLAKGPRNERAPSRVSDPADGQLPLQPWALEKVKEFQVGFHNPTKPEYIEPLARCAPGGIPKTFYWHGFEISQYPGYVLFQFNSGTRIIHLDGKPHLPANIKLWNGDSRGHWEGNTLVVDVANHNGKALFGRSGEFVSDNAKIQERYIFDKENKRFNYVATIDDPSVYTRPFTVTIPAKRWTAEDKTNGWQYEGTIANHPQGKVFVDREERICTENNGGFGLGARK